MKAAFSLSALALLVACHTTPEGVKEETPPSAGPASPAQASNAHARFSPAGQGDVPAVVETAIAQAKTDHRRLVVYEGASWCEPCQRFHAAVASGQLDAKFPDLTFLEFDADKDGPRLNAAGYSSQYIPLFALPGRDGRAAGPKASGGIKGDGAVQYLTNKLEGLLRQQTERTEGT